jgi:uncharacterized phage infection (PIP) family protein YhgE
VRPQRRPATVVTFGITMARGNPVVTDGSLAYGALSGGSVVKERGWTSMGEQNTGSITALSLLEGGTGVIGLVAVAATLLTQDWMTAGVLVVVLAIWGGYTSAAVRFSRNLGAKDASLLEDVGRRARRHVVRVEGAEVLPGGTIAELEQELGRARRWAIPAWFGTGQGVLVSLGLVGTFLGLTYGLFNAAPTLGGSAEGLQDGMRYLFDGAKLAFAKSLAGVLCGMIWTLRYRWLEARHEEWVMSGVERGVGKWEVLSDLALAARADHHRDRLHQELVSAVADAGKKTEQKLGEILSASHATSQRLGELTELVDNASKRLPENIGDQTAGLLKPSFEQITEALRGLSAAGKQAIGSVVQDNMNNELTGLRGALADISSLINGLGPRISAQVNEGAAQAASALTSAGKQSSDDLLAAAARLTGGVSEIQALMSSVLQAIEETHHIAGALRGAGQEVANELRGVADPLAQVSPALDGARVALDTVQDAMSRSAGVADAQNARMSDLVAATERVVGLQLDAARHGEALVHDVDRVRTACVETVEALRASSTGQQLASNKASQELIRTVARFQESLQETQHAMSQASQSAFEGAQAVTFDAAKRVADALTGGAETFEVSLGRLAAFSSEMEGALGRARDIAAAVEIHADQLQAGVAEVAKPLGEVASALGQVAPQVREAATMIRAEREAFSGVGKELAGQAATLRSGWDALGQRISEYKALQQTLSREWGAHLSGIEGLLQHLQEGWAAAVRAGSDSLRISTDTVENYVRRVESAAGINHRIEQLNETLQQLADVLEQAKTTRAVG